jgi:2-iminobutanoate/2-iminopropanoate deaminase
MHKIVTTLEAPAAIGPYSQGMISQGGFLFTAGQIGLNPHSGDMVEGGIESETVQALENLIAVLSAGNSALNQILKVTIFLTNIDDFSRVNKIYADYFTSEYPARSVVQVAALPKGALIEIECIAIAS